MKGEKGKLVLVYILMLLVIGLIVFLTFMVLNDGKEEKNDSKANVTPTVDVNPYPNVSDVCTFELTTDEYNGLTGPGCKGGYSRYNINGLAIDGTMVKVVVIYSDKNGNKAGLYINDRKVLDGVSNVTNLKFGIFNSLLFVKDTYESYSNVLVFNKDVLKVYDLNESLDSSKITDPILNQVISSTTINPNSFNFTDTYFTFQAQIMGDNNQVLSGSTYRVNFTNEEFSKPEFIGQN